MSKRSNNARRNLKAEKLRNEKAKVVNIDKFAVDLIKDRKQRANFYPTLRAICDDPKSYPSAYNEGTFSEMSQSLIANKFGLNERRALAHLIQICKRSKILDVRDSKIYVIGLINLVKWEWMWKNNPELWRPVSYNRDKQFFSLVKHLLCKYDVPRFMDKCWFKSDSTNQKYQEWYVNLGLGENIRKQKGLPIPLTKMMAHYFSQAPDNFDILKAIRWGQVMSMGANRNCAMGIMSIPLAERFNSTENEFWDSVIRFLINNPMLDINQYGPIYDYILNQKYTDRGNVYVDNHLVHLGPPQPNFSMHKRDTNALLRQVEEWHRNIRRDRQRYGHKSAPTSWISCGIPGFKKKGKDYIILIEEILTSKELFVEGEAQKHCVGSYVSSCSEHRIAIYSMRRFDGSGMYREATVAIDIKAKLLTEARKKCNKELTELDWKVISLWCDNENIKISSWIRR